MIFALITLLTALALAGVAGWFSILGFMAIYAGAPMYALIMGVVTECAKLVTTSWLYRNWEYASWKLKLPLLYFTIALMAVTSIGVFGFLSKAHLEQTSSTLDNSAKIETLDYQINREKSIIADNEKIISQLDATVNSYLGKDRTDRSLAVRKSQAPQRKQLRDDIDAAQKRIDKLSEEKFKLESEVRKLQLEVGPIRYIAELIYGEKENSNKNIESAVRIFTLLIVSTLDPLAVILLIAANHTLLRLRNEKEKKIHTAGPNRQSRDESVQSNEQGSIKEDTNFKKETVSNVSENSKSTQVLSEVPEVRKSILQESQEVTNETKKNNMVESETGNNNIEEKIQLPEKIIETQSSEKIPQSDTERRPKIQIDNKFKDEAALEKFYSPIEGSPLPIIRQAGLSKINLRDTKESSQGWEMPAPTEPEIKTPWAQQERILKEILGNTQHFVPKKLNEEEASSENKMDKIPERNKIFIDDTEEVQIKKVSIDGSQNSETSKGNVKEENLYLANTKSPGSPLILSWLKEFRR